MENTAETEYLKARQGSAAAQAAYDESAGETAKAEKALFAAKQKLAEADANLNALHAETATKN